jgi:hypothetical protein
MLLNIIDLTANLLMAKQLAQLDIIESGDLSAKTRQQRPRAGISRNKSSRAKQPASN